MMDINTSDVRVGSSTDLTAPKSNFRFTPESGLEVGHRARSRKPAHNPTLSEMATARAQWRSDSEAKL